MELNDSLPEARNSLTAAYLIYRWDLQHAERESARAVELTQPTCTLAGGRIRYSRLKEAAHEKTFMEIQSVLGCQRGFGSGARGAGRGEGQSGLVVVLVW